MSADGEGRWRCERCEGVLAARGALRSLHPTLVLLGQHEREARSSAQHGTGIGACPLCQRRALPLCFFEVPIDWCSHCGCVWLDGGELQLLAEQVRALGGVESASALSPYRQHAAAELVVLGLVRCKRCGAQVPVNSTYITSVGTLCVPCGRTVNKEGPAPETEAQVEEYFRQLGELDRGPAPAPESSSGGFLGAVRSALRQLLGAR